MALNYTHKRSYPFSEEGLEVMAPPPPKRGKPNIDIHTLASTDRQALERAAVLLNKSLSQLLEAPTEQFPHPYVASSTPPIPVPRSSQGLPDTGPLVNPQFWVPTSRYILSDGTQVISPLSSPTQPGQGRQSTITELGTHGLEAWQDVGVIPNRSSANSFLLHDQLVSGASDFQQLTMGECQTVDTEPTSETQLEPFHGGSTEVNDVFNSSPETSSEASENENNLVDTQAWENVSLAPIDQFATSAGSSGSDYIWIEECEESQTVQPRPQVDALNTVASQWIQGASNPKARGSTRQKSRGPFQDQHLRAETSNTRKLKACVRCRMQKVRCGIDENDPNGICRTCQAVSKQRVYTLPCSRYKITECTLYRTGKPPGLEFTFRWPVMKLKDITKWADDEIRTIQVQSDVCPVPLGLTVRRFVPIPQDSLKKGWMDGKTKKFKSVTPFAIVNMSAAVKDMKEYVDANVFECMKYFLQGTDALIQETYNFAIQHRDRHINDEEGLLMGNFFRLWFAVRRTATMEHIISDDKLDMEPENVDRSYPLFGKVALPPVMIQQLDMILTLGILQPLRKKVLEDFQKIVLSNKPSSWLTVYLITFMSLHSCASVSAENYHNARKHGLRRRYAMPEFISERHHAANVFLSHYHYRTQPCDPFKVDWRRRQATPFAEMKTDEIHFLKRTAELVEQRRHKFRTAKENWLYEDQLYFIAQMFEEDWTPQSSVIDFDDGTINNVPLRQYG